MFTINERRIIIEVNVENIRPMCMLRVLQLSVLFSYCFMSSISIAHQQIEAVMGCFRYIGNNYKADTATKWKHVFIYYKYLNCWNQGLQHVLQREGERKGDTPLACHVKYEGANRLQAISFQFNFDSLQVKIFCFLIVYQQ